MLDGSDAVADWPILNALVNTAGGASWVSLHHGGGVGMGYSIHAGMVIVADGTEEAAQGLAVYLAMTRAWELSVMPMQAMMLQKIMREISNWTFVIAWNNKIKKHKRLSWQLEQEENFCRLQEF